MAREGLLALLLGVAAELICQTHWLGDGVCDRPCMTLYPALEASDCASTCAQHCASTALSNQVCDTACNTWDCAWDQGDCTHCQPGCALVLLGNADCDLNCFTAMCGWDSGACSSALSPLTVYVNYTGEAGDGQRSTPFNDLTMVLVELFLPNVVVTLLPGTHTLHSNGLLLSQKGLQNTLIQGQSTATTVIQLTRDFPAFSLNSTVTFADVTFLGRVDLQPGCWQPFCVYCPYAAFNSTLGQWESDRGDLLSAGQFAPQSECAQYHDKVLFTVNSAATLTFAHVIFTDFRQQMKALIFSTCGTVRLLNFTFDHMQMAPLGLSGGLLQHTCPLDRQPYCGEVVLNTGEVAYLNDGYEYRPDIETSGVMSLQGIRLLNITNVTFRYCLSLIGPEVASNEHSVLLYLSQFRQVDISDSVFEWNVVDVAAVYLQQDLGFPVVAQEGVAQEQLLTHLRVSNCHFLNNSLRGPLLELHSQAETLNVLMDGLHFQDNFALKALICLANFAVHPEDENGAFITTNENGQVWFPPRNVSLSRISALNNSVESLLTVSNFARFRLTDCLFRNNWDGVADFGGTFAGWIASEGSYVQVKPELRVNLNCTGMVLVTNAADFVLTDSEFEGNYCPNGVSGLMLNGTVNSLSIHDNEFASNVGSGALTLDDLSTQILISLSDLTFRNNSNLSSQSPVCLHIHPLSPSNVTLTRILFTQNTGWFSPVLSTINTISLHLTDITLSHNTALYTCSGVLFSPYPSADSYLTITNSRIHHNQATSAGVISIMDYQGLLSGNNLSQVQIQLINTVFTANKGEGDGAGLLIGVNIELHPGSFIRNCTFMGNQALRGAAIFAAFYSGVLEITESSFTGNTGETGSALYLNHFYTLRIPTYVSISDCYFQGNSPGYAVIIEGYSVSNEVYSHNNRFDRGTGAYTVTSGKLVEANSVMQDQSAEIGAVMIARVNAEVELSNATIRSNTAANKGGAFVISAQSVLRIRDCSLTNNSAGGFGGVIYADRDSVVSVDSATFAYNSAQEVGSVVFIAPGVLTVTHSVFYDNYAGEFGSVVLNFCTAVFQNVSMWNNTSADDSPGIVVNSCVLNLTDSHFRDQSGEVGGFVSSIHHNFITVVGSTFLRGTSSGQGGAIFSNLHSHISVHSSVFTQCSSLDAGGAIRTIDTEVHIHFCEFVKNSAVDGGGLATQRSATIIVDSLFDESTVMVDSLTELVIQDNIFRENYNDFGGAIEISNVQDSLVSGNLFNDNQANTGGTLYLFTRVVNNSQLNHHSVVNNTFLRNKASAGNGGALATSNVDVELRGNWFEENIANSTEAAGGAVEVSCPLALWCNITIQDNHFTSNKANSKGGAIAWTDSFPRIANNYYFNNSAEYGADVASYAVKLALLSYEDQIVSYLNMHESYPLVLQLKNVASGQKVKETIRLGLFDQYSQLTVTDFISSAYLEPFNNSSLLIYGQLNMKVEGGVFVFQDLTLVAAPLTTQFLMVVSNGISTGDKAKARDPNDYFPVVLVEAEFRKCVSGESLQNNVCEVCPKETYSFDPSQPCLLCPSSAICYGNDTLVPKPGYWRITNTTDVFIECLYSEACVGSPAPPYALSLTGNCAEGYSGNLCQQCIQDYSRTGRYQCTLCPSAVSNLIITVLIVIVALVVLALVVWTAITSALKPQSLIATYIKIFTNYLQMVVVSTSLSLNWPNFAKTFLNSQEMAGGLAEQLFSFECLLEDVGVSTRDMYYVTLQIFAALPAVLVLLAMVVWVVLRGCKKVEQMGRKMVASAVIILFILHPSLTRSMFSLFACMDLGDSQLWLINDLSIVCWSRSHLQQILMVVLPSMAVYIFGLPLLSLLYLLRKRVKLESMDLKLMLCFLYKGYRRPHFYWEFVILYRKVLMIAAFVFLASVSITVQSLTVLAILLLSLFLQILINPFYERSLNRLEIKSILVSAITIYSGLYYSTGQLGFSVNILLFVIIVLANAYFLMSWLRLIFPVLLRSIRERIAGWFKWGKKYRMQGMVSPVTADNPDKVSSSIDLFSSDITEQRNLSVGEAPASHMVPVNTSVLQREQSEESKEAPRYSFQGD